MNIGRPSVRKARIEMVPLIDSFFLLLAFFISSVLSMSVMGGLPVELPTVAHTTKLEPTHLLVVTLARDGRFQLDGQPVDLAELATRLKTDPHHALLRVAVKADRLVPTGELLELLGVIRGAGVHRVGLVANSTSESEVP